MTDPIQSLCERLRAWEDALGSIREDSPDGELVDDLRAAREALSESSVDRAAALQDLAYRNGAQQALTIAHQSLTAADAWLVDLWQRSREARAVLDRTRA